MIIKVHTVITSLSNCVTNCVNEPLSGIPQENLTIKKPVFLGAALEDYVAIAALEINSIIQASENATTIQQYDSGHWVMLEAKDQVNSDLLAWIESL